MKVEANAKSPKLSEWGCELTADKHFKGGGKVLGGDN